MYTPLLCRDAVVFLIHKRVRAVVAGFSGQSVVVCLDNGAMLVTPLSNVATLH